MGSAIVVATDSFYEIALATLDKFYPERRVAVTNNEPFFVTPEIKYLLRKKNSLMRQGRLEDAGALSTKIGRAISKISSAQLWHVDSRSGTIRTCGAR